MEQTEVRYVTIEAGTLAWLLDSQQRATALATRAVELLTQYSVENDALRAKVRELAGALVQAGEQRDALAGAVAELSEWEPEGQEDELKY